jgi:hypothetical protein
LPAGKVRGDAAEGIDSAVAGQVPVWVEAGARFRGGLFFGPYASYGFGVLSGDLKRACDQARSAGAEVSCAASDVRVGLEVTYHVPIEKGLSAWVGGALGWEWLSFDVSETVEGQTQSLSVTANGMQPFMVQAGIDFEPVPALGLGPFVALTSDMYFSFRTLCQGDCGQIGSGTTTIQDKTWHHWFFIGARVTWRP